MTICAKLKMVLARSPGANAALFTQLLIGGIDGAKTPPVDLTSLAKVSGKSAPAR
jgi:hypothetical protein